MKYEIFTLVDQHFEFFQIDPGQRIDVVMDIRLNRPGCIKEFRYFSHGIVVCVLLRQNRRKSDAKLSLSDLAGMEAVLCKGTKKSLCNKQQSLPGLQIKDIDYFRPDLYGKAIEYPGERKIRN